MKTTNQKRYYTPQFSEVASVSIRRLAWAMNTNMVKTTDIIVFILSRIFDNKFICKSCKDTTKCNSCIFKVDESSKDMDNTWNRFCRMDFFKDIHEL